MFSYRGTLNHITSPKEIKNRMQMKKSQGALWWLDNNVSAGGRTWPITQNDLR